MANICEYEVHVKGTKKADLMVTDSMPVMDYLDIETEYSEGSNYAVPVDCEDAYEASVRILPGVSQNVCLIDKEMWMYHEKARAGVASIVGVTSSKIMAQLLGSAPLVLSAGWSDVCACILVQDTGVGSCSYQIVVITDNFQYQLRVQTDTMTDEEKNTLSDSVIEWLRTMRFDKRNESCPKEPIIDSASCRQSLENGDTSLFELALEQAKNECQAANNGLFAALEFAGEYGLLDDNAHQMAKNILMLLTLYLRMQSAEMH